VVALGAAGEWGSRACGAIRGCGRRLASFKPRLGHAPETLRDVMTAAVT